MEITIKQSELNSLIKSLDNVTKNLPKQLGIITWKTSRKTESGIAKEVVKELAATQKTVKEQISRKREKLTSTVEFRKSGRIPLRDFKARQTKKGVSYRISKSKGRRKAPHAFVVDKFGGRVYERIGKARTPIRHLRGPSPFGVFVKNNMTGPTVNQIRTELQKQAKERLRYLTLKKNGTI